jgi:hypothetical protein
MKRRPRLRTPALHLIKSPDLRYFWRIGSEFTRLALPGRSIFCLYTRAVSDHALLGAF